MGVVPSGAKAAGSQPVTAHKSVARLCSWPHVYVHCVAPLCPTLMARPGNLVPGVSQFTCHLPTTDTWYFFKEYLFFYISNTAHWDAALGVQAWSCHDWGLSMTASFTEL